MPSPNSAPRKPQFLRLSKCFQMRLFLKMAELVLPSAGHYKVQKIPTLPRYRGCGIVGHQPWAPLGEQTSLME